MTATKPADIANAIDIVASPRPLVAPMDSVEIYERLPHAYPFQLLDRLVSIDVNKAVALKNVSANEWWRPGHFPDNVIMPGVLILEAMAHTAGLVVAAREDAGIDTRGAPNPNAQRISVISGFKRVRFRQMVRPGDQLMLHATYRAGASFLSEFTAEAFVGPALAAEATLSLAYT